VSTLSPSTTDFATFGAVHLEVVDLERSLAFWRDLVGLRVGDADAQTAELAAGGEPLVVLHAGATSPVRRGHSGLYHLAIHLPDEPEFARVLARLIAARYPIAPTDHVMSKALYLDDPDGIGLELTLETPDRLREFRMDPVPHVIDADGNTRSGRDPLDIEQLLCMLPDDEILLPLPDGTTIGHVHLHVADLDAALVFYRDRLGFVEHQVARAFGMADLHAGGRFQHRLAVNTWQGAGAPQPPPGTAGLRHFTIQFDGAARLDDALLRLGERRPAAGTRLLRDPAGNTLLLAVRAPASQYEAAEVGC
jgi:catechol 2,3-dioxygenase